MVCAIFYTHKTSGECVGMSACHRTRQVEKTADEFSTSAISKMEFFVAIVNFQPLTFVLKIPILNDATKVLDGL